MNANAVDRSADPGEEVLARLALVEMKSMSALRARWLIGEGSAVEAMHLLARGRFRCDAGPAPKGVTEALITTWRRELATMEPIRSAERHAELGIGIMGPEHDRWPFHEDVEPPILLFHRGDPAVLDTEPRVAVVGTRRCTTIGRTAAHRLGLDLAALGLAVVSGLALGVDGSAHRGALAAGGAAVAVVATGLDVIYPMGNRELWLDILDQGLVLSESPAGTRPDRWRFPARNRLIAGLSQAVVIVESHARGGSLITADEAIDRSRPVFAVPGSILSPASDGSNHLLSEGAGVVRSAEDLLYALGLDGPPSRDGAVPTSNGAESRGETEQTAEGLGGAMKRGIGGTGGGLSGIILTEAAAGSVHLDSLVAASGRPVAEVLVAVRRLVREGAVLLSGSTVSLRSSTRPPANEGSIRD